MSSQKKVNMENAETKRRMNTRKNHTQLAQRNSFFKLLFRTGNDKLARELERTQKVIKTHKQCTCNLDTARRIKKRGRIWICSQCNGWIPYNVGLVLKRRSKTEKTKPSKLAVMRKKERELPIEPQRRRRKPTGKVGFLFLYFGIIALISSIIYNSTILAFTGLSLTLWGGVFLYAKAVSYVREDVLDSAVISSLISIDKILTELNQKGKGAHLPPRRLEQLKKSVVFLPTRKEVLIPLSKDLAQGKVFLNPDGISLTAPGQDLITLYEERLGTDFSKRDLNYLKNSLPKILIEDLEILEDLEIDEQGHKVHVKMKLSAYRGLCSQVRKQTSICPKLGCPLCSSLAGALAKTTGRAVIIERNEISPDGKTVETWYRLIKC